VSSLSLFYWLAVYLVLPTLPEPELGAVDFSLLVPERDRSFRLSLIILLRLLEALNSALIVLGEDPFI